MESFSSVVKKQLKEEEIKKKCCRYTLSDMQKLDKSANIKDALLDIHSRIRCAGCLSVILRELFIMYASVTDPEKSYHLDFVFKYEDECDFTEELLIGAGFSFHRTVRRGKYVLYLKESESIEDFLVYIGAQNAAFNVMNSKIVHEFRNSVNRQVNCDTANIGKQLSAAKKQTEAINFLIESGNFSALSEELKKTAELRLENDQLSLLELCKLSDTPITKSGMKHRLEKLVSLAEEYGKK